MDDTADDVRRRCPPARAAYFFQPDTMLGAALAADINLNGRVAGKSERGGFFFVDEKASGRAVVAIFRSRIRKAEYSQDRFSKATSPILQVETW